MVARWSDWDMSNPGKRKKTLFGLAVRKFSNSKKIQFRVRHSMPLG